MTRDAYLWTNAVLPAGSGELYLFGGASKRTGDAAGFFRPKDDARNVPAVYPNGFLPNIRTEGRDASLAFGYRADPGGGWKHDASFNHGRSELVFALPRPADLHRHRIRVPARQLPYRGGPPVSYQYGRTNDPAKVIRDQLGGISQADFGTTTTGKLIARFDPTRAFSLRASASTGFRAPSVQQKFYSSTNLNNAGVLTDTLTAREGSASLKDETSRSASVGMVLRPVSHFSVTADLYRTDIINRIVFSSTVAPESGACLTAASCPIRAILDPLRVGQAQFFTNAIDTETVGLDVVAEHTTWPRGRWCCPGGWA